MAENFGNESHTTESLHNLSVRHCDAGAFLAAVLECENPVIGLGCSRQFTVKNAKCHHRYQYFYTFRNSPDFL